MRSVTIELMTALGKRRELAAFWAWVLPLFISYWGNINPQHMLPLRVYFSCLRRSNCSWRS